jgi:hypothetical protein
LGRRFPLSSSGGDRRMKLEGTTTASELSAESAISFENPKL